MTRVGPQRHSGGEKSEEAQKKINYNSNKNIIIIIIIAISITTTTTITTITTTTITLYRVLLTYSMVQSPS